MSLLPTLHRSFVWQAVVRRTVYLRRRGWAIMMPCCCVTLLKRYHYQKYSKVVPKKTVRSCTAVSRCWWGNMYIGKPFCVDSVQKNWWMTFDGDQEMHCWGDTNCPSRTADQGRKLVLGECITIRLFHMQRTALPLVANSARDQTRRNR